MPPHTETRQFKTEQEHFWAGRFGDDYIARNKSETYLAANLSFFSKALAHVEKPTSCIEFGANVGMNLRALRALLPTLDLHAIEINEQAAKELAGFLPQANIHNCSLFDFIPERTWDLVLIKGVLIHINPDYLQTVYELLFKASSRYILLCEYYNPSPVEITYRGHSDRLFKRDFCGELMQKFPSLQLVDYGFVYHKDPKFPQDDITWFLMEKH